MIRIEKDRKSTNLALGLNPMDTTYKFFQKIQPCDSFSFLIFIIYNYFKNFRTVHKIFPDIYIKLYDREWRNEIRTY